MAQIFHILVVQAPKGGSVGCSQIGNYYRESCTEHVCASPEMDITLFFLGESLVVECLGHIGSVFPFFMRLPNSFPESLYNESYIPLTSEFVLLHILANTQ